MTVAQGLKKQTIIKEQTALGSVASGSGGQILRRRTSVFTAARDTFESDEIATHHQSTGVAYGLKSVTGKIDGLLSASTYKLMLEGLLEADFAAVTPYAAGIDVTAQAASPQFADASGGFLTAGLKVGHVVRWTGFAGSPGTNNNSKNFLITALTATDMTGVFLDGDAASADAAGDSVTCTVVGKVAMPPLTGHTNNYYTVEEFYSDITRSEVFGDCKVSQAAFDLPATGNASCSFDLVGLSRSASGAQILTTPTAETETGIMTAVNGVLYLNGTALTNVTGCQVSISNGAANAGAVVGSNSSPDVSTGRIKVSGSFTALFDSQTIQALFDAETKISLIVVVTVDETDTSDFVAITLGKIALTGDAPDDGEKSLMRTYPFTAELNRDGGASTSADETIIRIQDSAA